jgi:glycosyltransferase involved in cell wall biosynthesis
MPNLRILQLIDGMNIGGAEVLLRDLVRHLKVNGYEVSVGYSSPGPMLEQVQALNIPVTQLPRRARIDPSLFWGMVKLIQREKPDIVHTHLFKSDLHGRLAARWCRVPVVITTTHNNDTWARRQPLGWIYGFSNGLADRVIAVSEEVRDYQMRHTRTPREKFVVIDNGVDVSRFTGQEQAGQDVRAQLGISPGVPVVGILGRLSPQKDHDTFFKAARIILDVLPEARFLVVGDGALRETLEAQVAELGLKNAVIFAGIRSDVPSILAAFNLMVFSSLWEGLPVSLLEGMAAGLPIVSTDVGGVAGVARNGESALLVPPGAASILAQACLTLLYDPEMMKRFGSTGQAIVRENYSIDTMLKRTVALYEDLWQNHVKNSHS